MNILDFIKTTEETAQPTGLTVHLAALWQDAKGDWHAAHGLIDQLTDSTSAWVHAYLHRKEGDYSNARYWYNRAGKPFPAIGLQEEWTVIATALLAKR